MDDFAKKLFGFVLAMIFLPLLIGMALQLGIVSVQVAIASVFAQLFAGHSCLGLVSGLVVGCLFALGVIGHLTQWLRTRDPEHARLQARGARHARVASRVRSPTVPPAPRATSDDEDPDLSEEDGEA